MVWSFITYGARLICWYHKYKADCSDSWDEHIEIYIGEKVGWIEYQPGSMTVIIDILNIIKIVKEALNKHINWGEEARLKKCADYKPKTRHPPGQPMKCWIDIIRKHSLTVDKA